MQAQISAPGGPCVPGTLTEFPGSIASSSDTHIVLTTNSGQVLKIELPNRFFGTPQQACSLWDNRILLFGDAGGGADYRCYR
jgi:hypothetical protein